MKSKELPTAEALHLCFHYDPQIGVLTWRRRDRSEFATDQAWRQWNDRYSGKQAGWIQKSAHIMTCINASKFYAHRIIWKMMTGKDPETEIDHANGNCADNRWANLRAVTGSQNLMNRKTPRHSRSGIKGVRQLPGGRFNAHLKLDGKFLNIGTFATIEEAKAARDRVARELHGEFFNPG